MKKFHSINDLLKSSQKTGDPISEMVIKYEMELTKKSRDSVIKEMESKIIAMEESIQKGRKRAGKTLGGLAGSEPALLFQGLNATLSGNLITNVMLDALAITCLNASMGRVVAAPTAGSCGILPAAILNVRNKLGLGMDETVNALFVAAGIGIVIAKKATLSGAEGGCQAECGSAAAMAAGGVAALRGADSEVIFNAGALALKNSLGLTCDPVATLVEVPCIKRNAFFAVHAILAADLALCGIKSVIPFDEVIWAMRDTGKRIPRELKETSEGGLAITATGKKLRTKILKPKKKKGGGP